MIFPTDLKLIQKVEGLEGVSVKDMPQLYRASMEFALGRDPVLDKILNLIPKHEEFKYVSIDTRSHMLMKDMYPCIPGWHCDDFYRETYYHQPDLENITKNAPAIHYMLVIGDCSRTEFPLHDMDLPDPSTLPKEKPVYYYYDEMLDNRVPIVQQIHPETLYSFGPLCFHRGQAATKNGWRFFVRVTLSNHREPMNEIRYQTQVYTKERVSW